MKDRAVVVIRTVFLVLLLVTIGPLAGYGENIRVIYTDGRDPEWIPVWTVDETPYLSINDVGRIFGATKQWHSETRQMVVRYGEAQATLTVESPVVLLGDEAVQLPRPIRLRTGVVQAPLDLVTRVLPLQGRRTTRWDPDNHTLRVGDAQTNIGSAHYKKIPRGLRATLTLTEPLPYRLDPEAVGGFKLTLEGAQGDPERLSRNFRAGPVKRISAAESEGGMDFLFVPTTSGLQARVVTRRDPDRVVMDITVPEGLPLPEPPLKERWSLAPDEVLGRDRDGWRLDLVVIDPGHGGVDGGAVGPSGLEEKDIVLDVARRLEELLEERMKIEAVLTRDTDEFVPLRSRTEMANALDADLFVSIHCNASRSLSVRGCEVYFQSLEMDEEEQLVAEFENAVLALEEETEISSEGDLPFILWDLAQSAFMEESSNLAGDVHESFGQFLKIPNRGVKQANFVVLGGAHMPSILVEGAFLSNETEEALLGTEAFRQSLAEGIFAGIRQYSERYRAGK
jgi:N-acetylmuramoyl-L-alanine amidase